MGDSFRRFRLKIGTAASVLLPLCTSWLTRAGGLHELSDTQPGWLPTARLWGLAVSLLCIFTPWSLERLLETQAGSIVRQRLHTPDIMLLSLRGFFMCPAVLGFISFTYGGPASDSYAGAAASFVASLSWNWRYRSVYLVPTIRA